MATYHELLLAAENSDLRKKVKVATVVASEAIRTESGATPNHAQRLVWAKSVFESPEVVTDRVLWAVLAQNKDAAYSAIISAADAVVQTAVDAAVDLFAV
jgi:hypothetical protein